MRVRTLVPYLYSFWVICLKDSGVMKDPSDCEGIPHCRQACEQSDVNLTEQKNTEGFREMNFLKCESAILNPVIYLIIIVL